MSVYLLILALAVGKHGERTLERTHSFVVSNIQVWTFDRAV